MDYPIVLTVANSAFVLFNLGFSQSTSTVQVECKLLVIHVDGCILKDFSVYTTERANTLSFLKIRAQESKIDNLMYDAFK